MAQQNIGVVTAVVGQVIAVGEDGVERVLTVGDAVYADEIIRTTDAAAVTIQFTDGTWFDLGRNTVAVLDSEVFSPDGAEDEAASAAVAQVEDIQAAILAGADPTTLLPPTAAGPTAAGGGGEEGGHSFVALDHDFVTVTPQAGVPTSASPLLFANATEVIVPVEQEEELPPNILSDDDESVSTNEDTAVSGNVLDNTVNPDGPSAASVTGTFGWGATTTAVGLTASIAGVGTLVINSNGSYTFTPVAGYTGAVPDATYTVTDGLATDPSTLHLSLTPVGVPANILSDDDESVSTDEDTAVSGNVLDNTVNPDGPSAASVTGTFGWGATTTAVGSTASIAGVGTLVINSNGSYTFTPAANYDGAVPSATYSVSDGADTVSSTLSLSITPVNDLTDGNESVT
ncbi:MAG: retention module-containing protein, partial [Immundisolibacter sp.]|uniref:retention module-containing protein n=1 Tax=Immundisolibacter sp. TaxID=1934948 RepID=UPI003EE30102